MKVNSSEEFSKGLPTGSTGSGAIESSRLWTCGQPTNARALSRTRRSPGRVGLDNGIQHEQQTTHGRDHRHFVHLAIGDQMLVVGTQRRVPDDRGRSGAIQRASERSASTTDRTPTAHRSAIVIKRCDSQKGGGFSTIERAQLG